MAGDEDQEVETATNSTPEELERERLRKKVELGVEKCNLTDTDARVYINILCADHGAVFWRPVWCQTCTRPKITHDPVGTRCQRSLIAHSLRIKYELACKGNKVMNAIADILAVTVRIDNQARNTPVAPNVKFNNRIELTD